MARPKRPANRETIEQLREQLKHMLHFVDTGDWGHLALYLEEAAVAAQWLHGKKALPYERDEWSSYATFAVAAGISNDRQLYHEWYGHARALLRAAQQEGAQTEDEPFFVARDELAAVMQPHFEDMIERIGMLGPQRRYSQVFRALLLGAFRSVNWVELADHIMSIVQED